MSTKQPTPPLTERPAPFAKAPIIRRFITSIVLVVAANVGAAQDAWSPVPAEQASPPEAMLLPTKIDGRVMAGGGWVLSYRNGLRGSDFPDREVEIRNVTFRDHTGEQISATVSWEITRTQNNRCADHAEELCPDMLKMQLVPDGFIAVPESVWINEGASTRILIVPAGIG